MPQTYPQDYSCIIDSINRAGGLFIGNLQSAQNLRTLQKHGITSVLTAAKGILISHPKQLIPSCLNIAAEDHEAFDLSVHFDQAADFIANSLSRGNIMVHCLAGVSRSVSLVIAYLIKYKGMGYQQAYNFVKSRRKIIHPNDGFIRQLKKYQKERKDRRRSISPKMKHFSASPQTELLRERPKHYQSIEQFDFNRGKVAFSPARCSPVPEQRDEKYMIPRQKSQFTAKGSSMYSRYCQSSFYSPAKRSNQDQQVVPIQPQKLSQNVGRIKHNSSMNQTTSLSLNSQQQWRRQYLNSTQQGMSTIDTSDIDKKIEEIRKKYQEYAGGSYENRFATVYQAKKLSSKSSWTRPEESKRRDYNYLGQFERDMKRPATNYGKNC